MHRTRHYLEPLKTTRIPGTHVIIDTEAHLHKHQGLQRARWACGAAVKLHFDDAENWALGAAQLQRSPEELWQTVDQRTSVYSRTVVWAHNLAYDLRISDALRQLTGMGWDVDGVSLQNVGGWVSFKCGNRRLLLVDSYSWLPAPLSTIAQDVGRGSHTDWHPGMNAKQLEQHCLTDAKILADAVLHILRFVEQEDLGSLKPTGSGQSHAAWRRRWLTRNKMVVHNDPRALLAERRAMHCGRTEAWRHGTIREPTFEYDMNLAYCRIAATTPLPDMLVGERLNVTRGEYHRLAERFAVLADIHVTTTVPVLPTTNEHGVMWPVGTFDTTVWHPEIQIALLAGAQIRFDRIWVYRRGDGLRDMSIWLIDQLEGPNINPDPIVRRMLKHWARTLIGRCGLRYRSWEPYGTHPHPDFCMSQAWDLDGGDPQTHLRVGRQIMELAGMRESRSSMPQIPSYVMSACRAKLWRLIYIAGPENVVYMDTDSLIVNRAGSAALRSRPEFGPQSDLRFKHEFRDLTINGPRDLDANGERRLSGVPRRAVQLGKHRFEGEVVAGLEHSLAGGQPDAVDSWQQDFVIIAPDLRRVHLPDGTTQPYRLEDNEIV